MLFFCISVSALNVKYNFSDRFDSFHSLGLDAETIGEIETENDEEQWILEEIRAQLFYTVGVLNEYDAVGDIANVQIKILSRVPGERGFTKVRYKAVLLVGWPRDKTFPETFKTAVPLRGDDDGKKKFFEAYGKTCSTHESEITWEDYFYFMRLKYDDCKVLEEAPNTVATLLNFKIKVSTKNTEKKSPEYHKIWEDGMLKATMIFGSDHSESTSDWDAGISAFNSTYSSLIGQFGKPAKINVTLEEGKSPGYNNPFVEMEWNLADGKKLNAAVMLIKSKMLVDASAEFRKIYNDRTRDSDYVSYNGHSGFGENIRELVKHGTFVKNQYQLFLINGCDTFAYASDEIALAHQAVNPESAKTKYFDMITNAMPGYFHDIPRDNVILLNAMVEMKKSYRQILEQFPSIQKAVVTGEEDNRWPEAF